MMKAKGTKKSATKRNIKFEDYTNCLKNNGTILKPQKMFRSEVKNLFTEKVNKIALKTNDDSKLQKSDGITSYRYGTGVQNRIYSVHKYEKTNIMINFDGYTKEKTQEHNQN